MESLYCLMNINTEQNLKSNIKKINFALPSFPFPKYQKSCMTLSPTPEIQNPNVLCQLLSC